MNKVSQESRNCIRVVEEMIEKLHPNPFDCNILSAGLPASTVVVDFADKFKSSDIIEKAHSDSDSTSHHKPYDICLYFIGEECERTNINPEEMQLGSIVSFFLIHGKDSCSENQHYSDQFINGLRAQTGARQSSGIKTVETFEKSNN